tara:strand:- start:151 stop:495 length:345 start_codon:yes stop_codon:yes gene_type:complete
MNAKKIQRILRKFAKDREWDKFHSLRNLSVSISIEASELLEIFQWEENSSLKEKELKKRISEEIADILLYLLRFSDIAKLDLEKVCLEKIDINKKKYPVELSKGNAKKYNYLKK